MLSFAQPVTRFRLHRQPEPDPDTLVVTSSPESGPDDEDARLMAAAQKGDLSAFNQLVQRHERVVFSVCLRLLRDVGLAEDAGQDTFIRAWNAISSFRGGLVRPWLLRVATNRSYDILRAKARRPAQSLDAELFEVEPEWTSQSAGAEHPESFAARSELSAYLERALAGLPDDQRLAIILSDVQGYGYEEIARIMNVAIGTVKSRISRGRSTLREDLQSTSGSRELFDRMTRLNEEE